MKFPFRPFFFFFFLGGGGPAFLPIIMSRKTPSTQRTSNFLPNTGLLHLFKAKEGLFLLGGRPQLGALEAGPWDVRPTMVVGQHVIEHIDIFVSRHSLLLGPVHDL